MPDAIRIAIIEDIVEIGETLRDAINEEPDMECFQLYRNGEEAVQFLSKSTPDIVICDIGLPRMSGIDAMIKLLPHLPATQFCMYTIYEDDQHVFEALKSGAKGYILKTGDLDRTLAAIRELQQGGSPMSPGIARKVIDLMQSGRSNNKQNKLPLTNRETELLEYLSLGLLYKEIAEKMSITTGTVKQHIHKIYGKLQVANRTEAINKFMGK